MPNLLTNLHNNRVKTDFDEKIQVPDFADIQRIPPDVGIFDEPTRCYRINEQWAKIVMGWVKWLATMSAWVEAENDLYPAIAEILLFTIGENCVSFELRQSPTDNCIMEQSIDGGLNWTPVFDFSLCTSIVDGASDTSIEILNNLQINNFNEIANNFNENVYNNYVNNYINSITDIAPELGYGDSDDQFRDDALCFALNEFVNLVSEAQIEYYQSQSEVANGLLASLALAGAITVVAGLWLSGVGTPAAIAIVSLVPSLSASFGLGGSLYNLWYSHVLGTSQEQYEDLQAREDVVCCLLSQLESANVDQDDFQNVSSASCGLSTNAQAIFDACAILAGEDATYAAFVENMRIGFNSAKLGLLPACPCGGAWCNLFDFTVSDQSFIPNPAVPFGQQNASGYQLTYGVYNSIPDNRNTADREFGVDFTIDSATVKYVGTAGGSSRVLQLVGDRNNTLVFIHNFGAYDKSGVEQTVTYTGTHLIDELRFSVAANLNAASDPDALTIKSLQINGTTGNPPETTNC